MYGSAAGYICALHFSPLFSIWTSCNENADKDVIEALLTSINTNEIGNPRLI